MVTGQIRTVKKNRSWTLLALPVLALTLLPAGIQPAAAQGTTRTFPETGKTVSGSFLAYWDANGGLAQQGGHRVGDLIAQRCGMVATSRGSGDEQGMEDEAGWIGLYRITV